MLLASVLKTLLHQKQLKHIRRENLFGEEEALADLGESLSDMMSISNSYAQWSMSFSDSNFDRICKLRRCPNAMPPKFLLFEHLSDVVAAQMKMTQFSMQIDVVIGGLQDLGSGGNKGRASAMHM